MLGRGSRPVSFEETRMNEFYQMCAESLAAEENVSDDILTRLKDLYSKSKV